MIMPLASPRDRMTQVRWGMADFARRFGRSPEGLWLPECAVDRETLATLAACGIAFTILSPHQAARVRALPSGEWVDVQSEVLDVTRAYLCRPGPDLQMAVFFYERAAAREIAFGPLLQSGEHLANRLLGLAGDPAWAEGRLVHVATDGETYGHHHPYGEMALAYAIAMIEDQTGGEFTNYAAFLADYPPTHEVEIHDFTSWSCPHGVERWRADCGCRTRPDWHQRWRALLRDALDWLKGEVDALFEEAGAGVFHDPWAARDAARRR
jgi:alpha-amylase/alpha-mannosidase (GH57 family)